MNIGTVNSTTNFCHVFWLPTQEILPAALAGIYGAILDTFAEFKSWLEARDLGDSPPARLLPFPAPRYTLAGQCRASAIGTRMDVNVRREEGTFHQDLPIFTTLLGENNAICWYPDILARETAVPGDLQAAPPLALALTKCFRRFPALIRNALGELPVGEVGQLLSITGSHNCHVGCGRCCDGGDQTASPAAGGMYCGELSDVGGYCFRYQFGSPLNPVTSICREYTCGDLHSLPSCSQTGGRNPTRVQQFTLRYREVRLAEFLQSVRELARGKVPYEWVISQARKYQEVQLYHRALERFQSALASTQLSRDLQQYIQIALKWNDISTLKRLLASLMASNVNLKRALGELREWKRIYEGRRHLE